MGHSLSHSLFSASLCSFVPHLICNLDVLTPFIELFRPMARVHSDCLVSGKKKAFLIAVEDNTLRGFRKLYNAQSDAKKLRQLLIGIFNLLLVPHAS